jgi:hypothetical protein
MSTPAALVIVTETGEHGPKTSASGPWASPAIGAVHGCAELFLSTTA